jgi:hypothetical protein
VSTPLFIARTSEALREATQRTVFGGGRLSQAGGVFKRSTMSYAACFVAARSAHNDRLSGSGQRLLVTSHSATAMKPVRIA